MRSCLRLVGGLGLGSLALAACAAPEVETEWEPVESPSHFTSEDGAFTLELPQGWLRSGHVLARTPEGASVITFNAGPVLSGEDALAVEAGAPELIQAMSEQLATLPGVRVLTCEPVTLDGLAGFRAHYLLGGPLEADSEELVEREHLLYGAIEGEMLYAFSLASPVGAEFGADMPDFESLVASFRRRTSVR